MIPLTIKAIAKEPFLAANPVIRLVASESLVTSASDFVVHAMPIRGARAESDGNTLFFPDQNVDEICGDVILLDQDRGMARRLIRASSLNNTLLVTEQCDQVCVMCSQPPKKHHVNMFYEYEKAVALAPPNAVIGVSGGEPTLHKGMLFSLIENTYQIRPDIHFHVLTNGQHFEESDFDFLLSECNQNVLWGIPIYAAEANLHDELVGKQGAFIRLLQSLKIMVSSGCRLEMRTVVMRPNVHQLPRLARFIGKQLSSSEVWAIMQMERIGFGKMNWKQLFADTGAYFEEVAKAIRISATLGINPILYNFPICTVPMEFRSFAAQSISDWKQKYLRECDGCVARDSCGGFFEWYDPLQGFTGVHRL